MKRILRNLFFFLLCASGALAQTGNYFLSHYAPSQERFDNVCFDIIQDARGVMYFATKAGVLEFDGLNWDVVQGKAAIYSLQINDDGEIYWAGAAGFGKIGYDENGFEKIQLLSDTSTRDVFQSLVIKDQVYFLSTEAVYILNKTSQKIVTIQTSSLTGSFTGLFELYDVAYVNTEVGNILQISDGELKKSSLPITTEVIFTEKIVVAESNSYVIGTADKKIYACSEGLRLKEIVLEDQAYADASVVISGRWINGQLLALGTLRGGVIFVNPINGKTVEIANYNTGLPDNEVFAMMDDKNQNIWIAHDYGFTKIAPYMPFRSFSHYAGLQGNMLCASSYQNTVYVGTSLGLFKLEKEDQFEELIYYVNVEVKEKTTKKQPATVEKKAEVKPEAESKKKGFFSFLRRNKKQTPEAAQPEKKAEQNKTTGKKPKFVREKRTEKVLRSSQFIFKKVQGIEAKITHLAEMNGKLLASGLGGSYEVSNLEAKPILEEPVRYLYAGQEKNILLLSTYDDEIRSMEYTDKGWQQISLLDNLKDRINFIFQGKDNELWLCGLTRIYRLDIEDHEVKNIQTIDFNTPGFDETIGIRWKDEIVLVNSNGFFNYHRSRNKIEKIDSLPSPTQCFAQGDNLLYRDRHGWNLLRSDGPQSNLQLLNLFKNLRFVSSDRSTSNLWIISGSNELYKFFGEQLTPYEAGYPLFLKSIVNNDRKLSQRSKLIINQQESSITFDVVQPDYVNPEAVEFRYILRGVDKEWSDWSNNHSSIYYPYLPVGEYQLQVQSRNIFGKTSELDELAFKVLPPYWKRSWFYALEFAIFASLVLLSFRLSTRYRIISRLLSLLTIILLIQFIQTVINATFIRKTSPVVDFFIQVFIALLILPVEGYLRNLMLRSLDSSRSFYKFLKPRKDADEAPKTTDSEEELVKEASDTE
ncbi:MAG: triple tyrosine motif-containing protein [Bacteroidota bacterium]